MKVLKSKWFCDIAFLVALLFKVFSYGVSYYPVLDDYIQYGGYPLYKSLSHVYLNIGTIVTRPFASLLDPVVWGYFYPNMYIVLFIISVLFFFGARFLAKALERTGIYVTPFLYAILLLCPLGFEGTYWISASSRICVGLFFTGLALLFLVKVIDKRNKMWLVPYILSTLLSFGFYESVMIASALLQLFVILSLVKNKKKCFIYLITPAVCGVAMLLYYKYAQGFGALGSRASGFSFSGFSDKLGAFFAQLFEIFVKGGFNTICRGAYLGLKLMVYDYFGLIRLILAVLISCLCAYFGGRAEFKANAKSCILIGLMLTFLPFVPNILVDEVWLTFRSVVPCFIGLILVSAPLFSRILKKKSVRTGVIFVMVLVFSFANVNELDTYRRVNKTDNLYLTEICEKLDNEVLSGNKNTIVVLKNEIVTPQVSYYKDHVKSVFSSDWALTGAIRAKCKNINIKTVTPVFSLDGVDTKNSQIIYIGGSYER